MRILKRLTIAAMLMALAAGCGKQPTVESTVREISAFVEHERGLRFRHPPRVRVDPHFDIHAHRTPEEQARDRRDDARTEIAFKALGLLAPEDDLYELIHGYAADASVGVYDPETATLTVSGSRMTPFVRTVLAHELTHALDDQHFGLHRPELEHARDETAAGFWALMEGSARRVERAYVTSLSVEERTAVGRESNRGLAVVRRRFPKFLRDYMDAPYVYGPGVVATLVGHGGTAAIDAAFREPPQTSEQLMFPERLLERDGPHAIAAPRADGPVRARGVLGAELLASMLAPGQGAADAGEAVAGWGGGRYVAWLDRSGRPCLRATLTGDTPVDTAELSAALRTWSAKRPDARVTETGARIVLTSCGSPAPRRTQPIGARYR